MNIYIIINSFDIFFNTIIKKDTYEPLKDDINLFKKKYHHYYLFYSIKVSLFHTPIRFLV